MILVLKTTIIFQEITSFDTFWVNIGELFRPHQATLKLLENSIFEPIVNNCQFNKITILKEF